MALDYKIDEELWVKYLDAAGGNIAKAKKAMEEYHSQTEPPVDPPTDPPTEPPVGRNLGVAVPGLEFSEKTVPGKEGQNYKSVGLQEYKDLAAKGFKYFRIPFISERFNSQYLGYIEDQVKHVKNVGGKAWLDFHEYGRTLNSNSREIIAHTFESDDTVECIEIDNEPHSGHVTRDRWYQWAEDTRRSLREIGWNKLIGIPIYHWSALDQFPSNGPDKYSDDPGVRYIIHNYFDKANTGFNHPQTPDQSPEADAKRLQNLVDFARERKIKFANTEYGTPGTDAWINMLPPYVKVIKENPDVITHDFYWASRAEGWYGSDTVLTDKHLPAIQ